MRNSKGYYTRLRILQVGLDRQLLFNYNIIMDALEFVWDIKKETLNRKKHGVSFEEAKTAFYDPNALLIADPKHSFEEYRFVLLGLSYNLRLLVICHCYREKESIIRIISARKASKKEERQYRERLV